MKNIFTTGLLLQFLLFAFNANASTMDNPLTATARMKFHPVPSDLTVDINVEPGFYAYLDQFKVKFKNPSGLTVMDFDISPVNRFFDQYSKKERLGIKDKATLMAIVVGMAPKIMDTDMPAMIELTYQACSKQVCLFPKTISVKIN
jgi:hypothetical protein